MEKNLKHWKEFKVKKRNKSTEKKGKYGKEFKVVFRRISRVSRVYSYNTITNQHIYTSKRKEQNYSKYRVFSDVKRSINIGMFDLFQ